MDDKNKWIDSPEMLESYKKYCEMEALIAEIAATDDYENNLKINDDNLYIAAKEKVEIARNHYRAYVKVKIAESLQSPADTSDLSV